MISCQDILVLNHQKWNQQKPNCASLKACRNPNVPKWSMVPIFISRIPSMLIKSDIIVCIYQHKHFQFIAYISIKFCFVKNLPPPPLSNLSWAKKL